MNTSVCIICAVSFSQGETLELHSSYRDPGNHYPMLPFEEPAKLKKNNDTL